MDTAPARGRSAAARLQRLAGQSDDGRALSAQGVQTGPGGDAPAARRIRKGEAMNLLDRWIHAPVAAALGRTLLHSLWEGAAVALMLALVLCFLRSSRARYAAAC